MRDVERWLANAPRVTAPDNFLEDLMARIRQEDVTPLPVRPTLPMNAIGYALVATAAAMVLLAPFMTDITRGITEGIESIIAFFGNLPRFGAPADLWRLRP